MLDVFTPGISHYHACDKGLNFRQYNKEGITRSGLWDFQGLQFVEAKRANVEGSGEQRGIKAASHSRHI